VALEDPSTDQTHCLPIRVHPRPLQDVSLYTLSAQRAGKASDPPGPSVNKFTTAFQCSLPSKAANRRVLFGLWVVASLYYMLKHLSSFLLFKMQVCTYAHATYMAARTVGAYTHPGHKLWFFILSKCYP
jgi:hypothetical protein